MYCMQVLKLLRRASTVLKLLLLSAGLLGLGPQLSLGLTAVSYTHLDVYKRQVHRPLYPGDIQVRLPLVGAHKDRPGQRYIRV